MKWIATALILFTLGCGSSSNQKPVKVEDPGFDRIDNVWTIPEREEFYSYDHQNNIIITRVRPDYVNSPRTYKVYWVNHYPSVDRPHAEYQYTIKDQ